MTERPSCGQTRLLLFLLLLTQHRFAYAVGLLPRCSPSRRTGHLMRLNFADQCRAHATEFPRSEPILRTEHNASLQGG